MNSDKTNFMVFLSGKSNGITVLINGHQIAQVHSSKYIGLYIDDDLKWKNHIEYIYGKLLKVLCSAKLLWFSFHKVDT